MNCSRPLPLWLFIALCLGACGDSSLSAPENDQPEALFTDTSIERSIYHKVDIVLTTPLLSGNVSVYRMMEGKVVLLENYRFDHPSPTLHIGYEVPESTDNSAILIHVTSGRMSDFTTNEFVCFAPIPHSTTRHQFEIDCGYPSTIAYYLASTEIGQPYQHPFHDADARLPLWQAITEAPDNNVTGFYVSVFGTLQNALIKMGVDHFDLNKHSVRPVMEAIVAQFLDTYQRIGSITSQQLIEIANSTTDNSLPLERLIRYSSVFNEYAHIENIKLENTGGSLTKKNRQVELLTMSNELSRFYLRHSPFEMSDFRTHIVQNVRHQSSSENISVLWDPISHMYGYNLYLNGEHLGYSRVPGLTLPLNTRGTVTIKAVGYAGEFDGVHHELSGPTLIAGSNIDDTE